MARMGKRKAACRVLVGKPEGRRPLGRPRRRWGIILNRIFKQWNGDGWTDLAQALIDDFKLSVTEWPGSQMRTTSCLMLPHHCCSVLPALTQ